MTYGLHSPTNEFNECYMGTGNVRNERKHLFNCRLCCSGFDERDVVGEGP